MLSAPTGKADYKQNGVFTHYGMQLGSGTWDFWPSLTYTGRSDRLTWGAQVLGIVRMEKENQSGLPAGRRLPGDGLGQLSVRRLDLGLDPRPLYRAGQDRGPL